MSLHLHPAVPESQVLEGPPGFRPGEGALRPQKHHLTQVRLATPVPWSTSSPALWAGRRDHRPAVQAEGTGGVPSMEGLDLEGLRGTSTVCG